MSTRPLDDSVLRVLQSQALTYREVGGTAADLLPVGFHHLEMSRVLGQGREDFDRAVNRLMTWRMHELAGLTVASSSVDVRADGLVVLGIRVGPVRLTAPCRVVYVVDEHSRRGFAYGTLPGHPESGEEAFTIEVGPGGQVIATIRAFSRPASLLTRLGGPLSRHLQTRATGAYLAALAG